MQGTKRQKWFVIVLLGLVGATIGLIPNDTMARIIKQQNSAELITDSRFVFEPNYTSHEIQHFLNQQSGVLKNYTVPFGDQEASAAEIIFSHSFTQINYINPKILLTLLEMRSRLLSDPNPSAEVLNHPFASADVRGFEQEIGFFSYRIVQAYNDFQPNTSQTITFRDGTSLVIQASNAGSFALHVGIGMMSKNEAEYQEFVRDGEFSFINLYTKFFGNPLVDNRPTVPLVTPPFLYKPFEGTHDVGSFLDHDARSGYLRRFDGATSFSYDNHTGTDYPMNTGTIVQSAASGTVIQVRVNYTEPGAGSTWCIGYSYTPVTGIVIRHMQNGITYDTWYWHLNNGAIAINPRTGQPYRVNDSVNLGETIGYSGRTGCVTGPHLHFELRRAGTTVDPYGWCGNGTDPWGTVNDMLWAGTMTNPSPCSNSCDAFTIGEGSTRPQMFINAFNRRGGRTTVGCTTNATHWWGDGGDRTVVIQNFTGGSFGDSVIIHDEKRDDPINSTPAYVVQWGIFQHYQSLGGWQSWLGPPTSDEFQNATGQAQSNFANGYIAWNSGNPVAVAWPTSVVGQWRAEYHNGRNLNNYPTWVMNTPDINYEWMADAPGNGMWGVWADDFSVRWTGEFQFMAADYTFISTTDDGVRVWIDNQLVIDKWQDQTLSEYRVTRPMNAGNHQMKIEYYEGSAGATAKFRWEPNAPTIPNTPANFRVDSTNQNIAFLNEL